VTLRLDDAEAKAPVIVGDRRGELRDEAAALAERSEELATRAEQLGQREQPIVNMGLALADRFIDRVQTGGPDGNQTNYWNFQQNREVARVLDQTAALLDQLEAGHTFPGTVMRPTNDRVRIEGSDVLLGATPWGEPDAAPTTIAGFLGGYGHFMKVDRDLPNFPEYGAGIIQQGHGAGLFRADGTFPDDLGGITGAIEKAEANRMKIDYLTGSGVPKFAETDDPSLFAPQVAFIRHNIDHPLFRKWTGKFIADMLPQIADSPAIASICIVNEPGYVGSGRNPQSRAAYHEFLRERHGDIASLNKLYETKYADFGEIDPPPFRAPGGEIRENLPENRAYYDWAMFNREHFGAWHRWMHEQVKAVAPHLPTHAKVMADTVFSRRRAYKGTDPEAISEATDLAGVDAWHFEANSMDDPYSVDEYAYQWQWPLAGYDLFHSFRGQPVFDSERHVIRDGGRRPTREGHLYTVHWLGALHNAKLSTMWVWEESAGLGLSGNVSKRPADIYDAGRAMFDLSRLWAEVDALSDAPEEVAILYSSTALIWQPGHDVATKRAWTAAANLGLPTTFVTAKQLQEDRAADVKVILLPRAAYLQDATVAALAEFVEQGGTLIALGDDNLRYDEYGRERDVPEALAKLPTIAIDGRDHFADEQRMTDELRELLVGTGVEPVDIGGAFGIARRLVEHDGRTLLALTNMRQTPQKITFGENQRGLDLISGEAVELTDLELPPLRPMLIEINR
jgi:hypothetical protein